MTETIKDTNDALNAEMQVGIRYEANGKQVILVVFNGSSRGAEHVADAANEEKAKFITDALNEYTAALREPMCLVGGSSLDDFHKSEMLKAFGIERD